MFISFWVFIIQRRKVKLGVVMALDQGRMLIHDLQTEEKQECVENEGLQTKEDPDFSPQNLPNYPFKDAVHLQ